jgi:eukaryotic translation initiation factor 2C
VLEQELPRLKGMCFSGLWLHGSDWSSLDACKSLKINPKITVIVVGKRHHVRFFPSNPNEADRSQNCIAGTVVDTDVAHPVEFDFYLQSHGGLLGTSRPSHYNVLHDENQFGYVIYIPSPERLYTYFIPSPDGLQQLSFALCHVYARATRSVSIPAPVYCKFMSSTSFENS